MCPSIQLKRRRHDAASSAMLQHAVSADAETLIQLQAAGLEKEDVSMTGSQGFIFSCQPSGTRVFRPLVLKADVIALTDEKKLTSS